MPHAVVHDAHSQRHHIAEEHDAFTERLAAMARRLRARGAQVGLVIDGEVVIAAGSDVNGDAAMVHHRDL